MARMKKITKIYEEICLIWGLSVIILLTFFLTTDWGYCIILMEPAWYIRTPEIILGIIAIPYYVKKIYGKWIK